MLSYKTTIARVFHPGQSSKEAYYSSTSDSMSDYKNKRTYVEVIFSDSSSYVSSTESDSSKLSLFDDSGKTKKSRDEEVYIDWKKVLVITRR